ncbi:MAG TPA: MucBP domain-containing protein [Lactobacillaceae bacterium]
MADQAAPVWVYFEDIATHEALAEPQRLDGALGADYSVAPVAVSDYTFVNGNGRLAGIFGQQVQNLHLYYRPNHWAQAQQVQLYLQALKDTPVYVAAQNDAGVVDVLAAGSFWEADLRVVTTGGQFWYRIGVDQWVLYAPNELALFDDAQDVQNAGFIASQQPQANQPNALIDFLPGQTTEVYAEPYGLPVGSVLDGDFVSVVETLVDKGVVWYRLADLGWLNAVYVQKLD